MRFFVLAFVAGTCWLQSQPVLPAWHVAWLGGAFVLSVYVARDAHAFIRIPLIVASGALLGIGIAAWRAETRLADELPRTWEGVDIAVVGVVASLPQETSRGTRFDLDVESIETPRARVPKSISFMAYRGGDDASPESFSRQRIRSA